MHLLSRVCQILSFRLFKGLFQRIKITIKLNRLHSFPFTRFLLLFTQKSDQNFSLFLSLSQDFLAHVVSFSFHFLACSKFLYSFKHHITHHKREKEEEEIFHDPLFFHIHLTKTTLKKTQKVSKL